MIRHFWICFSNTGNGRHNGMNQVECLLSSFECGLLATSWSVDISFVAFLFQSINRASDMGMSDDSWLLNLLFDYTSEYYDEIDGIEFVADLQKADLRYG